MIEATSNSSPDMGLSDEGSNSQSDSGGNKICRVCGDRALSVNFNAVTCESCKAFFRRNALKPKDFRCPFKGNCEMNVVSRKFCKKCRFRKCFEVGMMKEWIMTDEARTKKRQLIQDNRERRRTVFATAVGGTEGAAKIFRTSDSSDLFDYPSAASSVSSEDICCTSSKTFSPPTSNDTRMNLNGDPANEITIPKSVLLNLINQCKENKARCKQCPSPPIVERARRIYEICNDSNTRCCGHLMFQCICTCMCGAKSPSARLGADTVEKAVSTDDDDYVTSLENDHEANCSSHTSMTNSYCDDWSGQSCCQLSCDSEGKHLDEVEEGAVPPDTDCCTTLDVLEEHLPSGSCSLSGSVDLCDFAQGPTILQKQQLEELAVAMRKFDDIASEMGYNEQRLAMVQVMDNSMEEVKVSEFYVRRTIEMYKMLNGFKILQKKDQVLLLKTGMPEQMLLRSVVNYSHEKEAWYLMGKQHSNIIFNMDVMKQVKPHMHQLHLKFVKSFLPIWIADDTLMSLLMVISMLNPDRNGLVDKEIVRQHRQEYCGLLKSYLLSKYDNDLAKRFYVDLCQRLKWLSRSVHEMSARYHIELDAQDVAPLMIEILYM